LEVPKYVVDFFGEQMPCRREMKELDAKSFGGEMGSSFITTVVHAAGYCFDCKLSCWCEVGVELGWFYLVMLFVRV